MPAAALSVAELSRTAEVRACLDWFRRERAWINEQHLKLCRVAAPTFLEARRAAWIAERFRELGWEARIDKAGNVLASLPGRADDPSVAVTAHLDTVLAPRTEHDIAIGSEGRFLGPGVSDNGAGLAALLAIAGAWQAQPPLKGQLPFRDTSLAPLLVANVGEEGEGNLSGMRFLCRQHPGRPKAFLVLDGPSTDHITYRALGSRRFEVIFEGPGGHSWSDHGSANPVHALGRLISTFTEEASRRDGVRSSFNFGIVHGGTSVNCIPVEARAKVDLRSEEAPEIDRLASLLAACMDRAAEIENVRSTGGRITAAIKEIGSRPGGELAPGASILEAIQAVDAHMGIRASLDCSSTDANIPLSLGLPAISIGAGGHGGGAHTPAEWYHPDGREAGLQRVLLTLCLLLGA